MLAVLKIKGSYKKINIIEAASIGPYSTQTKDEYPSPENISPDVPIQ